MNNRFWFYLGVVIILIGLVAWWALGTAHADNNATTSQNLALQTDRQQLQKYLATQKNAPKLIGLAKRLNKTEPALVQPVIERAYVLAPTNPDVVLLESYYHPELKTKAQELNPLIK